jgi:L-asparaginase
MPSPVSTVVVVGTGGTIAGTAADAQDQLGYRSGALTAADLVASVPALAGQALDVASLAQLDSCDMDHATWWRLARTVQAQLNRPEVAGVVVTHGTDTLEETAMLLHHTVQCTKPVVLTAAMRPATALSADGPLNLFDAVCLARHTGARGVLALLGGQVFAGAQVRKVHGSRLDAFGGGDAGPLALVRSGQVSQMRSWPTAEPDPAAWPLVDIVTSHAGARGQTVQALVAAGARGLVLAGSGNGSVHIQLVQAALEAQAQGVVVRRATRCVLGGVVEPSGGKAGVFAACGDATPAQARVVLMLELTAAAAAAAQANLP